MNIAVSLRRHTKGDYIWRWRLRVEARKSPGECQRGHIIEWSDRSRTSMAVTAGRSVCVSQRSRRREIEIGADALLRCVPSRTMTHWSSIFVHSHQRHGLFAQYEYLLARVSVSEQIGSRHRSRLRYASPHLGALIVCDS